jgi:FAD/FMN-containing dehydrogenase
MVSTNASGAHTLRFGSTRPWVMALDCVFEDGSRAIISRGSPVTNDIPALNRFLSDAEPEISARGEAARHRGLAKDSSGYGVAAYARTRELVDLLVGSEGTLAIIVGIELALTDLPIATSSVLGAFASLDHAVSAAVKARECGASACELLDRTFLDVAASGDKSTVVAALASVPKATEAVLLAEVEDENAAAAGAAGDELARTFTEAGATVTRVAIGPTDQHEIWELRHAASPILSRLDPNLKSMQFIEDGAVPPSRLAEYVRGVRSSLEQHQVRGVIFGHAGDSHVHVNPLVDVGESGWRGKVEGLLSDVVDLTARLGGTLSGEHGDGRLRTPLLEHVWSDEACELFGKVKNAFDPRGIFNPGVKVPLTGQKALGDIKYDPSLAPLPPEARDALDKVSNDRAYSTLRLSLLNGEK